jgi:hypothetical protein
MNYFERTSIVLMEQQVPIGRSFLTEQERTIFMDTILTKEMRDKQLEENQGFLADNFSDNLKGHERTGWYLHEDKDFKHCFDNLKNILDQTTYNMACHPLEDNRIDNIYHETILLESWFARSKKNAHTSPHNHGIFLGAFAFSCYLQLPSKNTTLTFAKSDLGYQKTIHAREGDIIIFPSNMSHWSFGLEEERCIVSGNFLFSVRKHEEENEEEVKK